MDTRRWLRDLKLEQYEGAFRDNDIDAEVLTDLTADDLTAIGVASVGHRRKLLAAIADLKNKEERSSPTSLVERSPASHSTSSPYDADRRQITVVFCDIVGSTALAGKLDPEDLRELLGLYRTAVSEEIARFEGFVAKFMGDGVLAYFGYPQAHEDDPEQAIRAGLAIAERIGSLKLASGKLAVRIGIATGIVVVGDLIGSGEAQERGVVGETPNLAARLQALAEPNGVIISDATKQLVGGLFDHQNLGSVEIRGLDNPVRIWRVLRPSTVESRLRHCEQCK